MLLSISITAVLWALLSLVLLVALIWFIIWVVGQLGLTLPPIVVKLIWIALTILGIILIIDFFFGGGHSGISITR